MSAVASLVSDNSAMTPSMVTWENVAQPNAVGSAKHCERPTTDFCEPSFSKVVAASRACRAFSARSARVASMPLTSSARSTCNAAFDRVSWVSAKFAFPYADASSPAFRSWRASSSRCCAQVASSGSASKELLAMRSASASIFVAVISLVTFWVGSDKGGPGERSGFSIGAPVITANASPMVCTGNSVTPSSSAKSVNRFPADQSSRVSETGSTMLVKPSRAADSILVSTPPTGPIDPSAVIVPVMVKPGRRDCP